MKCLMYSLIHFPKTSLQNKVKQILTQSKWEAVNDLKDDDTILIKKTGTVLFSIITLKKFSQIKRIAHKERVLNLLTY